MTPPTIHTDRLILRPLGEQDFAPLCAFYASDRSQFVGGPEGEAGTWRILATEIGHWTLRGYGRLGVEEQATGAFCGLIGPFNPHGLPEPEIAWDLMNGFEGKGYATEAGRAALDFVYQTLGWTTAISLIAPVNEGSMGVARRLGAVYESDFDHERYGTLQVWRHAGPEAATA